MQRSACSQVFAASFIVLCAIFASPPTVVAQTSTDAELSPEEQREKLTAERFLQVLLKRPSKGTALDRVFGYHIGQGDIGELIEGLSSKAQQLEDEEAGRHWLVIGLLQLQRSEDAAAIDALRNAEQRLPGNAMAAYYLGQAMLLVGQTDAAAAAMKRAIDLKPPRQDYLKIASQLGQLYQRDAKTEEALQIWEQLEAAFPGDDGVRQRIARVMLDEGDLEGALGRYDQLAQQAKSPNDKIVFALRAADLRVRMGAKDQAITEFEGLLRRLRPGSYLHDEARRRIENAFLDSADYAGLTNYYEKWVEDNPEDVDAVIRLARTLSVQGRGPEALKWFELAIEKSPSDPGPRVALVNAYLAQNKYVEAAKQYESLVKLEPSNPDHLVRWGQVLLDDPEVEKAERSKAAAAVWMKLAESRSEDAVIQSQVADLLRGADLEDQAITQYRAAIDLAPDQPQYKEYLGEYLHQLDRKDEAVEVWKSLAEGELRTRDNLVRLAEVFQQFERPGDALSIMAEACELDPTIEHRLRYAELLRSDEQYEQALEQLAMAGESAETFDESERVFAAEVKTYQESGQLAERIETASAEAEGSKDGNAWRQLAILHNASGEAAEAVQAIEKSLELSPQSIESLVIAARMYEDSGRLNLAIEKRVRLAETDARFRAGHLQKLASLHLQVGDEDQAIAVGKSLLAASAGSIDAHRFYAELCGRIGRIDERLDTLRRCARMNPRDNEAQRMLASQLAEDFKTEQAIELYWKMLDGSKDLEDRRIVVQTLTDLYLRSNRLDQLIARLEIRGRESGDRRATVDLVATAHQQAGDLGLARQALEGLMREDGRDTLLLERLVSLAELSGEYEEAVRLQRQLTALSPERKNEARLASLLIDTGALEEAQAMWARLAESSADPDQIGRNIDRLFAAGESATAVKLATSSLVGNSDDWQTLTKIMILHADEKDWEKASEIADKLDAFTLDEKTLPTGGKPYNRTVTTSTGQTYTQPPLKMVRLQNMYPFYQVVDERYGYNQSTKLPEPMDFGQAKLMGLYCQLKHRFNAKEGGVRDYLKESETKAKADDATGEEVWNWYQAVVMSSVVQQTSSINFQQPAQWTPLWRMMEVDGELGTTMLTEMLTNRQRYAGRTDIQLEELPKDRMQWLKEKTQLPDDSITTPYGAKMTWSAFYAAELRIAGKKDEADEYFKKQLAEALEDDDASRFPGTLSQAATYGTDDQLWPLIQRAMEDPKLYAKNFGNKPAQGMLTLFTNPKRIEDKFSKGSQDPVYRERVMSLVDRAIREYADEPLRRRTIQLTGVGGPRSTYRIINGNYERIQIEFPPKGLGPDDTLLKAQYTAWQSMKDHTGDWIKTLREASDDDTSARLKLWRQMAVASLLFWDKRPAEAITEVESAATLAAEEVPQLEPELRLMSADLLLREDRKRDALKAIDSLAVYDQRTMALREFAAARLAAAIGDRQRAQTAARRLFGVRLNTDAQIELAKLMRKLDMRRLASDLVRRMRNRGGGNTDQLQSLMTYFVAQGETDQAAAVAMDLLRRSAPPRRTSSRYTTSNQARRKNALQTLATTGRLTALITATEKRFENAPKSQRIRSELAEMYAAAGKTSKAQELLGGTDIKDVNSTRALEMTAEQLVAAGKMDEACDAYLKYLRRRQDNFSQKFYDIKRPFDNRKRLADLADLMMEVGIEKFTDYRVAEICEDLIDREENVGKARELYSKILDRPNTTTNSMHSMSNIMGSARELLTDEATVLRTADYLIESSLAGTGWNTLFDGYSTSSDGRHNNVTTYFVRHVAQDAGNVEKVEKRIREKLEEASDWQEGKIWLGLLMTSREQYDEAKTLLEPLVTKELSPLPTHDTLWLVGSLVDSHDEMHELSERIYDYALAETKDQSNREFKYSLRGRVCNFMADTGRKDRAREMILAAIEDERENPPRQSSNAEYAAYQQIRTTLSRMDFLSKIDCPTDALRLAREFDQSLFVKAGRYQRGRKEEFERKRDQLLDTVRKMGGLATVRSMINTGAKSAGAVDFAITLGNRPFTESEMSSLWLELLHEAAADDQDGEFPKLVEELKELSDSRPQDETAAAGYAFACDAAGDAAPLWDLVSQWSELGDQPPEMASAMDRRRIYLLALLRLGSGGPDGKLDERSSELTANANLDAFGITAVEKTCYFGQLGQLALDRGDKEALTSHWERVIELKANQWLLLDLSQAAVDTGLKELSAAAFTAAVESPAEDISEDSQVRVSAGSLGQLLSSAQPRTSSSSRTVRDDLDPEQVRLSQRILELDDAWRKNKLFTKFVYDPLVRLTLDGGVARPLCMPVVIKNDDRITVDSVFDRLARRAGWSKRTDKLLEKLSGEDAATHLLAAQVLLRNDRGEEAAKRYQMIDSTELKSLSKEMVLGSLLLGLENEACRETVMKHCFALVDQNRPTQRYATITPYDTLSLMLAKTALNHGELDQAVTQALTDYLELTAHDNDRYSSSSSQYTRRITQLEKVAQLVLPKGRVEEALRYLGMRRAAFDGGYDRSNDWVGSWALESINGMSDRVKAYEILAEFTFQGDGPLSLIQTLVRRQPLPEWIPSSVGGGYPPFPPVADPQLPIATNLHLLVHLAVQTDQIDALTARFAEAEAKQRVGADVGLAIALTATERTVEPELIEAISARIDSVKPGQGVSKTMAPLAELQLASMLARDPANVAFAKKVTGAMFDHMHTQSRSYLNPWVARFEHQQGWNESSSWKPMNGDGNWLTATIASGKDLSEGKTPSIWVTDGSNQIRHVCGFGKDYAWLRYPLEGNFTIEMEASDGGWSEPELAFDGLRFASLGHNGTVYINSQGNDWLRVTTKATKKNEFNRCKIVTTDKTMDYYINDTLIYQEDRRSSFPWAGIHSTGNKRTTTRAVRITGDPVIPRSVNLIPEGSLRGWSGEYFGEAIPTAAITEKKREKGATFRRYRTGPKVDRLDRLAWSSKDGELVSGDVTKKAFQGQSVIRYMRPLGDGETLSYEFLYEDGKTEVHPSIGRVAYLLRPSGVHLHWMAAPSTSWTIPAKHEVPLPGAEPKTLALKEGDWNDVELKRVGEKLQIRLNGELVFDREVETRTGEMIFGLFHYADTTSARIRNVTLSGDWPETLPESLLGG